MKFTAAKFKAILYEVLWFEEKVDHLRHKILHGYKIESRLFTLDDMTSTESEN